MRKHYITSSTKQHIQPAKSSLIHDTHRQWNRGNSESFSKHKFFKLVVFMRSGGKLYASYTHNTICRVSPMKSFDRCSVMKYISENEI